MTDITVVIVTFDRQPMLNELLYKLSRQTVVPEVIVNDDGTRQHLDGHEWPLIKRYLWHERDGYHRVARYNEAVNLVETRYLIMLDDDCLPDHNEFIEAYLMGLSVSRVVRGLMRDDKMAVSEAKLTPWFSTANVGFETVTARALGPFDMAYDGKYGFEDNDLGNVFERDGIAWDTGNPYTSVLHRGPQRPALHVGYEANRAYYKQKWNL